MYSINRILKAILWLIAGKPHEKRRVRLELARLSASLFGNHFISEDYALWREDKNFFKKYLELSPNNTFSQDRKFMLREFLRKVKDVKGSMAECGSYEGATAWFMANEFPKIPLYLFDSFEGLSTPDSNDKKLSENHFSWKQGDLKSNEEKLQQNLSEFNSIILMKGWIPERFNEIESEIFRLVHIDVDLYQPTKDSIEFFYPRLSSCGVIVLDDYGVTSCPGAYKAINEYMEDKPEYVLLLTTSQGIIIKQ